MVTLSRQCCCVPSSAGTSVLGGLPADYPCVCVCMTRAQIQNGTSLPSPTFLSTASLLVPLVCVLPGPNTRVDEPTPPQLLRVPVYRLPADQPLCVNYQGPDTRPERPTHPHFLLTASLLPVSLAKNCKTNYFPRKKCMTACMKSWRTNWKLVAGVSSPSY